MKGYQEDGSPAVTPRRALIDEIEALPVRDAFGRVTAVQGLLVEVESLLSRVGVGARFIIRAASGRNVACEVVGFHGEPPTCGDTPTVFTECPRLPECAGPGVGEGAITGVFTVPVQGDDHDEPVADAVHAIVDRHGVMGRSIAGCGRYSAINVLKSVSRTMPRAVPESRRPLVSRVRRLLSLYADSEELIRRGAGRKGSDPDVDEAIRLQPAFAVLAQDKAQNMGLEERGASLTRVEGGDGQ